MPVSESDGKAADILRRAVALHRQGGLREASALYEEALRLVPGHFDALHLGALAKFQLGDAPAAAEQIARAVAVAPRAVEALANQAVVLASLERFEDAIGACDRAIAAAPDRPDVHYTRGNLLCRLGRFLEGVSAYDRALAAQPGQVDALVNRGNALRSLGRLEDALADYARALAFRPDSADVLNNYGNVLVELGRGDEALAAYDRALMAHPDHAELHFNRGNALRNLGRADEALASYDRALVLRPGHLGTLVNRGNILQALHRLREALADYERALRVRPDHAEALVNRGNVLQALGRPDEALDSYDRAVAAAPGNAKAHNNRGAALLKLGRTDDALTAFDRALACAPDYAEAFNNRGNALYDLGRYDAALANYLDALALQPGHPNAMSQHVYLKRLMCDWSGQQAIETELVDRARSGRLAMTPLPLLAITDDTAAQRACATAHWRSKGLAGRALPPRPAATSPRIRLGYISADFRQHAVPVQAVQLFEAHDRSRFDVVAFSVGPENTSAMRQRLVRAFDGFIDLRQASNEAVARRIRDERIDVLVDLSGFIDGGRPEILAWRPAPVQVHYFGYPGPMGTDVVDYMIVDRFLVPPAEAAHYTEKLVYLPDCYMVSDQRREVAERRPARADCGLPEDGFVFCSFNNNYKIAPPVFDVWMRLLAGMPGSVLWLLADNRWSEANLRREAGSRGIDPGRLVFAPRRPPPEHLARVPLADLFLDTLPYNAHVTASEALWRGVPLVTCSGRSFASRVAGSLLRSIGVPELATGSLAEYEALALRLAREPSLLADLRGRIGAARATAAHFDIGRMCRQIETAYQRMTDRARHGMPPESFAVE